MDLDGCCTCGPCAAAHWPCRIFPPAHSLHCYAPLLPAELQAFDSAAEWRGPLFRLPITVIKPLDPEGQPGSSSGSGAVVRSDCSVDLGECFVAAEQRTGLLVDGALWQARAGKSWPQLKDCTQGRDLTRPSIPCLQVCCGSSPARRRGALSRCHLAPAGRSSASGPASWIRPR